MTTTKRQLGKFDIIARIGRGGMAEVYKAYQPSLDRFVAVKLLHPFLADDPEFKDRFEREARNVARLKHQNIVQVYDFEFDSASESYYMVMELIDGKTLKELLDQNNGKLLPLHESLRFMSKALEALAYAHSRSMIHRDLKPANLMIEADGRLVLTDFGIAKIVTGNQFTQSGGMVGTPAYMSPEQGLGEAGDERGDIYSMGVIMFQLVTGKLPFDADTPLAVILKHLNDPIPSIRNLNPEVPEAIEKIIRKAMAKDPDERYRRADDMLADIGSVQRGGKTLIATAAVPRNPERPTLPLSKLSTQETPLLRRSQVSAMTRAAQRERSLRWLPLGVLGLAIAVILGFVAMTVATGVVPLFNIALNPTPVIPTVTASPTNATLVPSPSQTLNAGGRLQSPTIISTKTSALEIAQGSAAANTAPTATVPTSTVTPSKVATIALTDTPKATATFTPSLTITPSATRTPTATFTPTATSTPTVDLNQTRTAIAFQITQAALVEAFVTARAGQTPTVDYTATAERCQFKYDLVSPIGEPTPSNLNDPRLVRMGDDFAVEVVIRNTGTCDWLQGIYMFSRSGGDDLKLPSRITVAVPGITKPGETVKFILNGAAPVANSKRGLVPSQWEIRTEGNQLMLNAAGGDVLAFTIFAYGTPR